ncbi:38.7 kDa protein [Pieris rapae granulovirus Wuhan]|uniref:38.7 kDa protein n=1 Tax=Pieris rapae granulovirus Wuhan TaxID=2848030 RepID=D2J4M6_9BBAC|nr:38.7 kDa protein [Betabaculovirus arrapae]ACZ63545.1 38.7 kDa protein [Betabaculovirus arrapae]
MYYYWNKISDYVWGASKDLYQRLHACEIKLDLLTKCLENLYRYNNNKMEDTSKLCVGCGECESEIENDIDEEDDGYHEDYDSDGSNLGVFIKARINDNTQLQYITGKQDRYNMRKILYSNMENIVDRKEAAPRKKIDIINDRLNNVGFKLTHISNNSVIVNGKYDDVKRIIENS